MADEKTSAGAAATNEIDLDAHRKEATEDALAYVDEVNQLCAIALCPGKAASYIAARTPLAQIRQELVDAKASADEEIDATHEGSVPAAADPRTTLAEAHASTMDRYRRERKLT